ncbi:hypothetical protein P154DRAFT_158700 [Amniculicola lignicola CBS 123094]|uniref:Uncharacterized protein n=1 Tax=Amniculicola lignicola CBS 123094 TaxID=1392246 RepID=A0A6A5WJ79_9PLEO|nr:hypothetical protein P154DRAFT_158700 [Amniculicola lignicola CBS 123094]
MIPEKHCSNFICLAASQAIFAKGSAGPLKGAAASSVHISEQARPRCRILYLPSHTSLPLHPPPSTLRELAPCLVCPAVVLWYTTLFNCACTHAAATRCPCLILRTLADHSDALCPPCSLPVCPRTAPAHRPATADAPARCLPPSL